MLCSESRFCNSVMGVAEKRDQVVTLVARAHVCDTGGSGIRHNDGNELHEELGIKVQDDRHKCISRLDCVSFTHTYTYYRKMKLLVSSAR